MDLRTLVLFAIASLLATGKLPSEDTTCQYEKYTDSVYSD
jgi:hypothetical protein